MYQKIHFQSKSGIRKLQKYEFNRPIGSLFPQGKGFAPWSAFCLKSLLPQKHHGVFVNLSSDTFAKGIQLNDILQRRKLQQTLRKFNSILSMGKSPVNIPKTIKNFRLIPKAACFWTSECSAGVSPAWVSRSMAGEKPALQ
jgi:hypothetical protein